MQETKRDPIDFSKQLIKGKIAEMIFSQMFRNSRQFTVIPFGYETTFPEIAQYAYLAQDKQVLETIKNTPDFAIVSHDKRDVYLIEVKYRTWLTEQHVLEMAEKINDRWKSVQLFISTPGGFFFGNCSDIIMNKGKIMSLEADWIDIETQKKYTELLMSFIDTPTEV